jgi:predicted acylesterase/phospholipase RssA
MAIKIGLALGSGSARGWVHIRTMDRMMPLLKDILD